MKTLFRLCLMATMLAAAASRADDNTAASQPAAAPVSAPIAASVAASVAAPSAAQLAAATRMLRAFRLDEGSLLAIKKEAEKLPDDVKFLVPVLLHDITLEHVRAAMAPVYSKYLTEQDMSSIAAFYESMAGKKAVDQMMVTSGWQKAPLYPPMSAQESTTLRSFEQSEEARRFVAATPLVNKEAQAQFYKLGQSLFMIRLRPALEQMQQWMAAELKARSSDTEVAMPEIKDSYSGIPEVDRAVKLVGECYRRQFQTSRDYRRGLKEAQLSDILKAPNVADLTALKRSTEAVAKADMALETYLKQLAANQETATAEFSALTDPFGKAFAAGALRSIANNYGHTIQLAENQRSILESYRHLLAFAEQHHDDIRLSDNKLLFTKDEEAQDYNALVAQLRALAAQESKINAEARDSLSKGREKLMQGMGQ